MAKKQIKAVIGRRAGKTTTEIQAYIFMPKEAWTAAEVKAWLRKYKKKSDLDITGTSYRARQADPKLFHRMRTITIKGREDGRTCYELQETETLDDFLSRGLSSELDDEVFEAADDSRNYATVGGKKVHRRYFAYAPAGTGPSEWKLPLDTEKRARNALSRYSQADLPAGAKAAVKRKILRYCRKYEVDTSGFEKKHMTRVKAAEARLSEMRDGKLRIMVAYTNPPGKKFVKLEEDGTEREFEITEKDLQEMLTNLQRDLTVPVDYGHWSAKDDAPPGYDIKAGEILGDGAQIRQFGSDQKALWAWMKPTGDYLKLIREGKYTHFSPEIKWDDQDENGQKIGTHLKAGAATNRPFLKQLPKIEISGPVENEAMTFTMAGGYLAGLRLTERSGTTEGTMAGKKTLKGQEAAEAKKLELRVLEGEGEGELESKRFGIFDGDEMVGELDAEDLEDVLEEALEDGGALEAFRRRMEAEMRKTLEAEAGGEGKLPPKKKPAGEEEPDEEDEVPEELAAVIGASGLKFVDVRRLVESARKHADGVRAREVAALLLKEACDPKKGTLLAADFVEARVADLATQGKLALGDYVRFNSARRAVESAIKQGKILPREAAYFLNDALARPEEFAAFVKTTLPKVNLEALGATLPDEGQTPQSVQEELNGAVAKYMSDKKEKDAGKAMRAVLKENAELRQRYEAETQRIRGIQRRGISLVQ